MEQRKVTVLEFKAKKKNLVTLCKIVEISRSCIYLKTKLALVKPPGRPAPGFIVNRDGEIIYDEIIINHLKEYRSSLEFSNAGGARKLSHYLAIEHKIYINHKKIYRLCDESDILLFKKSDKQKKTFIKTRCKYTDVSHPNQLW